MKDIEVKKLVNIITKTYPNKYSIEYPAKAIRLANELLEHYQPKLPEDSIVLTREKYDALKLIENYHIKSCGKNSIVLTEKEHEIAMRNQYDVGFGFGYQKGSKETAEKILKAVLEEVGEFYAGDIVEELAKQFGVEIKE